MEIWGEKRYGCGEGGGDRVSESGEGRGGWRRKRANERNKEEEKDGRGRRVRGWERSARGRGESTLFK